ncbi:MAG: adenylate cyclase [Lysobacterales bacterium]|jgi:adenylate cyclase
MIETEPTGHQNKTNPISVSQQAIADEIRIVQSVQAHNYMPALLFGNAYPVIAIVFITWPVALTTGAIYSFAAVLILLLPMIYSYFRIRGKHRPESVSKRRILTITYYSFFLGFAWAVTFYLMSTEINQVDGISMIVVMYLLIYGSVSMMPSVPSASIAYMSPIVVASFFSAYWNNLLTLPWLVLMYFGAMSAVALSMWQNWHDLKRSVRLRLENLQAQQITEESRSTLERVSSQLAKYVSPQLYRVVLEGKEQVAIASQRKKLTVFFSDIAGFTETTDQLESEELTALLNQYLTEMVKIAQDYGANFDKFIGDAIVLYFGDPDTRGVKEDASACVHMAIAMQRRMRELQAEWLNAGLERPLEIRIGINTGYCTVGNFGSENRMDYTIIGGEVNLAARLERESEVGGILLAHETYSLVKDWVEANEAESISVRGYSRPVTTYRVKEIHAQDGNESTITHLEQDGITLTIDQKRMKVSALDKAIEALHKAREVLDK